VVEFMEKKLSKELKDLERKLANQRKEKSEQIIKEKMDKKKLDYDTIALILEIFENQDSSGIKNILMFLTQNQTISEAKNYPITTENA